MPKLGQRGLIHFLVLFILIAGLIAALYLVQKTTFFKPKAAVSGPVTPTTSFVLLPNKSQFTVGEEVVITILVHSDIAAANLFSAKLNYDPAILQLDRVDTTTTLIKNWVEQNWAEPGKISLVGSVPNPGFQSQVSDTTMMTQLYFKAVTGDSATISFDDTSAIYSNADNVNILTGKNPITLTITPAGTTPQPGQAITYTISENGWNFIGIPARFSMAPADFLNLTNGKCTAIQGFDPLAGQAREYFSDPAKAPLNTLTQVTGGNGYLIQCSGAPVSFNISVGDFITALPDLVISNVQYVAVPKGYNKTAEQFLDEVTNSNRNCTEVDRYIYGDWEGHIKGLAVNNFQMNDLSGYIVKCISPTVPSPTPVVTPAPGTGDGNGDGKIDLTDLSILLSDFNKTSGFRRSIDLNGDGIINSFDFGLMRNLLITKGVIKG